jgi:hypothetical protein
MHRTIAKARAVTAPGLLIFIQPKRIEATSIPTDYLERGYAGVLGKIIGVYLGDLLRTEPIIGSRQN